MNALCEGDPYHHKALKILKGIGKKMLRHKWDFESGRGIKDTRYRSVPKEVWKTYPLLDFIQDQATLNRCGDSYTPLSKEVLDKMYY